MTITEPNTAADPECPLSGTIGHQCHSRDHVERVAAGQPPLMPGGSCYGGSRYQLSVESEARAAAVHLAKTTRTLLDVLHEYGLTHADAELEISDLTDACFMFECAGTIAGWSK